MVLKAGNLKTFQADVQRQHGLRLAGSAVLWCIMLWAREHGPVPKTSITGHGGGFQLSPFRKVPSWAGATAWRGIGEALRNIFSGKGTSDTMTRIGVLGIGREGMQGFPALMRLAHLLQTLALPQTTLWLRVLKKTIQGTVPWIVTTTGQCLREFTTTARPSDGAPWIVSDLVGR